MKEIYEKNKRESFSLPPSLVERLKTEAKKNNRNLSNELKNRIEWSFKQDAK
jgi:predicted DNA-binding protein